MRGLVRQSGAAVVFYALVCFGVVLFAAGAFAQQGARATVIPQASRQAGPAFELADVSGNKKQLTDYRGKVVVLNFWATACGGSQQEIPWLIELAAAHKSDAVVIVGISMDTSYEGSRSEEEAWSQVRPYVADHKLNYPVLLGDAMLITTYKLASTPATYVIDKQGRVAAVYSGVADKGDVDANVRKLLAEQ